MGKSASARSASGSPGGHIANLRKQIDKRFYSPRHVAGVVLKLLRILHWRVKAKALLTIPVFLTLLIVTQMSRKLRKQASRKFGG